MKKEFDFDTIGKRLPYTLKEGTMEDMTARTLIKVRQHKNNRLMKRVIGVAASIIIICCATAIYHSNSSTATVDELITNMSDSELEALVSLSDSDVLFNEEF